MFRYPTCRTWSGEAGRVAAYVLGRRVDDDIGPHLDRPHQSRRTDRVIDHERDALLLRQLSDRRDVGDEKIRVAR